VSPIEKNDEWDCEGPSFVITSSVGTPMVMNLSWKEKAGLAGAAAWLIAFGLLLHRIVRSTMTLRQITEEASLLSRRMQVQSEDILELTRQIKTQSREIDFLQSMVKILP